MTTRRTTVIALATWSDPYAQIPTLVCAVCEREVDPRTEACRDVDCDGCTHLRCDGCLRVTARDALVTVDGLRFCAACDEVEAAA